MAEIEDDQAPLKRRSVLKTGVFGAAISGFSLLGSAGLELLGAEPAQAWDVCSYINERFVVGYYCKAHNYYVRYSTYDLHNGTLYFCGYEDYQLCCGCC